MDLSRAWAPLALAASVGLVAAAGGERALVGQLDREVIALKQTIDRLQRERAACADLAPAPIYADLLQVFAGGVAKVDRDANRARVTIPAMVLFGDEAHVRDEALPMLDLLATVLNTHPDTRVAVVGHVDGPPPLYLRRLWATAWDRSAAEAVLTARVLIDRFGLAPARLTVSARADLDPLVANDTPESRAINHRIVLLVSPGAPR